MMALAVVLLLNPVLADDGDLRLVASGVGDHEVVWVLDGVVVARTADREAVTLPVPSGSHELQAHSNATTRWQAVARPDPDAPGATYVPAWTALHEPTLANRPVPAWSQPTLALGLAAVAVGLLLAPGRRGLEGLRRRRRA